MLIVAAILALGVGYYVPQTLSSKPAEPTKANGAPKVDAPLKHGATPKISWAASAPGRVEPLGGEARITAHTPGRIAEVLTAVNDKVFAGDLLVRLDDDELLARVHSATAEAAIRRRDRDNNEAVGRQAQDRRSAEDAVANAERQLAQGREELDRQVKSRRGGSGTDVELAKAREAVGKARERLDQARVALRKALAVDGLAAPTRPEAALAAARAELSTAEAALERTRIRAASSGSVLLVHVRAGETVAPSPENVLVIVGDLSALRVKAEFEDRDLGKIRVGQAAVVRSDAFPGKDFAGKVVSLAQTLGPSRLGQRGPRKPNDVDVLEAIINLDGQTSLLPGMRVDVFLVPEVAPAAAARPATAAKAN